jgi:hypothetical protein
MAWPNEFYKRRKKPLIGFILVLLLGPLGFLYHSWKSALSLFLVVGPLWIIFLRNTPFDLIRNPWAHYVALLLLAGFASLQIKGQCDEIDRNSVKRASDDRILAITLSLLSNDVERRAFKDYLAENSQLSAKLLANTPLLDLHDELLARWEISNLLTSYGMILGEARDYMGASSSLLYSLIFFEENPIAWASMAEVYVAWEDCIASRWAKRVINFKITNCESKILNRMYSSPDSISSFQKLRGRMQYIVNFCAEHPEWRDSYAHKRILPMYRKLSDAALQS